MDQVLYVKYNSLRKPDFRIATEIRVRPSGEKYVAKRATEPAAKAHINTIENNRTLMEDYYTDIQLISVQRENDTLVFPFVKGVSLKEKLENDYRDRESLIREAEEMLGRILSVKQEYRCDFEACGEFRKIFGDVEPGKVPAVCPANIDGLFSNFMETDGRLQCIDYEWVFNFSVPVGFIRYRALRYLHYELRESLFSGVSMEDFLGWFGIKPEEQDTYGKMELDFQYHVHGEKLKYHYLSRYLKDSRSPAEKIEEMELLIQDKDRHIGNLDRLVHDKDDHIRNLDQMVHDKDVHIRNQNSLLRNKEAQYNEIANSFSWKMTKPLRASLDKIKKTVKKRHALYHTARFLKLTLRHGPGYAREQLKKDEATEKKTSTYVSRNETARQRNTKFDKKVVFSILVPLYNTPKNYLAAMIQSVLDQTYSGWELCLADGSDAEHSYVGEVCKKYTRKDSRIKYRKLDKNLGISGNTNACLEMATGDYIGLFDHDDLLHPYALFEYMKAICEKKADFIYSDECTFHEDPTDAYWMNYKPDYAPDTLRSYNYICHFTVFKRNLLEKAGGGFRERFDGSQDYDLILRLTEQAEHIVHIPKVLYYWRSHKDSTASDIAAKPYTMEAAKKAIAEHLDRIGLKGTVTDAAVLSNYKVQYEIEGNPLISIVIPNKDHRDDLEKCLNSIREKSTWNNWEIIVVENNSTEEKTFEYYREIEKDNRIRVITWKREFNYSAINNFGVRETRGEYILLLNNDIEVITPDWMEQMLMFVQREDVGAAGAMLYYPDDTIQHAGVILGIGGVAGHSHKYFRRGEYGYASRLAIVQNLSAVTAACIMMPRKVWDEIDGLDEKFAVAFNDVDLCMRIRKAGYLIVWTPYAELYHYESKSRGTEDNPEKQKRFKGEIDRFMEKWGKELEDGDPYYNPNLTLGKEDFSYKF